jgi:hypothetical protein
MKLSTPGIEPLEEKSETNHYLTEKEKINK